MQPIGCFLLLNFVVLSNMARAEKYHKSDKDLLYKVGLLIRQYRCKQNLTLEQLGSLANIHYKYIQRCETGKANISISIIYSLCKVFNITLATFFNNIDND